MADMDYYGADYGAEAPSRLAEAARNFGLANWLGAATSLGLTAGLAVWAVDLTFRDVSAVPVVRAIEGPMRVAPEDPGGAVAPYQGLALSDITSGGAATPAPEQIVLAPPPVTLAAPSQAERADIAATTVPDRATAIASALEEAVGEAVLPVADTSEASSGDLLADLAAPHGEDATELAAAEVAPGIEGVVAEDVPGLARSSRPAPRPRSVTAAARIAAPALPTEAPAAEAGTQVASLDGSGATTRDADPAAVVPGTRVVQLGAFDSEGVARSEWDRLAGRFGAYMAGKQRLVQKANSGGREFWRLRVVGFEDGADARRFCAEFLARDAACIPVTVR